MRYYLIMFFAVLIGSSALVDYRVPAVMGTSIAGVKPASHGLIRPEGGMQEIRINDAARVFRFITEITEKHPNRGNDFPMGGTN